MAHLFHRRSIRLPGYDYRGGGTYFVTICTHDRALLFGDIKNGVMELNEWGRIVADYWHHIPDHFPTVDLDTFVVMPNHIHGIVCIRRPVRRGTACDVQTNVANSLLCGPPSGSLGAIIRSFKSACTKRIRESCHSPDMPIWHRNYHEHIIRNDREHQRIRTYILQNPSQWNLKSIYIP